ncbi:DUF3300 domain-containing protein [Herbaspirillum sp. NPDC101396]|uniref:DUF3300 domain-containing protein n=1 Tax=Herbaspirillum sp. NPDC101396 TaxID=3364005 RepID=UPI00383B527B
MNKKTLAWIASALFSLASGMSNVSAQDMNRPPAVFTQEELDQMLAPVALYPDSLLAQVLMAATYPLEVVQAARFVDSRPGLQGDALARAIAPMPWDPSVKSLAQFPSVLAMMNDKLDWTQRLGDAFLSQQANVMDTVQNLRVKAQIAGNLQSSNQQRIVQQDQIIVIEPVNPQVIYVPYYNPTVVYGGWWWPQRPPVYWAPPPRYRPPSYNVSIGISFGAGTGIVRSVYSEARPDWRQHHVLVNNVRINNVNVTNNVNRNVVVNNKPVVWQHSPRNGRDDRRPDVGNVSRPNPVPNAALAPPPPNQGPRPDQRPGQAERDNDRDHRGDHDRNDRNDRDNRRDQNRPAQANLMAPNNAPTAQRPAQAPAPQLQAPQARPAPAAPVASPAPAAHQNRPERPERAERPDNAPRQEHRPEPQAAHRAPPPQIQAAPRPEPQAQVQRPAPAVRTAPPPQERHEQAQRPEPRPQQREERPDRTDRPDRK